MTVWRRWLSLCALSIAIGACASPPSDGTLDASVDESSDAYPVISADASGDGAVDATPSTDAEPYLPIDGCYPDCQPMAEECSAACSAVCDAVNSGNATACVTPIYSMSYLQHGDAYAELWVDDLAEEYSLWVAWYSGNPASWLDLGLSLKQAWARSESGPTVFDLGPIDPAPTYDAALVLALGEIRPCDFEIVQLYRVSDGELLDQRGFFHLFEGGTYLCEGGYSIDPYAECGVLSGGMTVTCEGGG